MTEALEIFKLPIRLIGAFARILRTPKLLALTTIPYLIGISAFLIALSITISYRDNLTAAISDGSFKWLTSFIGIGYALLSVIVSGISALLAVSVLGSVFYEELVDAMLIQDGLKEDRSFSISTLLRGIVRGLYDSLIRILYIAAFGLLAFVSGFFPPLYIVSVLLGFFVVGLDLFGVPLALLNFRFKERLRFAKGKVATHLLYGALFSSVLVVPLVGVLGLPFLYGAIVSWLKEHSIKVNETAN